MEETSDSKESKIEIPPLSAATHLLEMNQKTDLRRSRTLPSKVSVNISPNIEKDVSRTLSYRKNKKRSNFPSSPYYSSTDNIPLETPGITKVPLTVVNVVSTPTPTIKSMLTPKFSTFEEVQTLDRNNQVREVKLVTPNQYRAFALKAISYQKRQWFNNICCIALCPFMMVFLSFLLKILISNLFADDQSLDFDVLYCSDKVSTNEQNWPIYNIAAEGISRFNASSIPGAKREVRAVNYLSRLSLVDLAGSDPISTLATSSVAGSVACVQWFGEQYNIGENKIYEGPISPLHGLYTSQIRSGWLDVLDPTRGGTDLENPYAIQALSLLRTFFTYQTRLWAVVGHSNNVDAQKVGSNPREPIFNDPNLIPSGIPYYKSADESDGILGTIEPRYYVQGTSIPPRLEAFEKTPYFLTNFTTADEINDYLISALRLVVQNLANVKPLDPAIEAISPDIAVAEAFFRLQNAVNDIPYGGVYFTLIDHLTKQYQYTLQYGGNPGIDQVIAFPNLGIRRLIQQSQLSNGILRFSNPDLAKAAITAGTRAFPKLEPTQIAIPFGSLIGRILYPLATSFLLPIFTLELVRDKESKILVMLRMNGLGDVTGYYVSAYITFFLNYVVAAAVFMITGYATSLELFVETEMSLLILLFFLWGHIQTGLAFLFSSFFRSTNIATIGVFLLVICGVVTSFLLDQVFDAVTDYPYSLLIWPPFVFYRALGILNYYATSTKTASYSFKMVKPGDAIFNTIFIMAGEAIIIILISIYTTQVIPSDYGQTRPWNFPFTSLMNYFRKSKSTSRVRPLPNEQPNDLEDEDVVEEREKIINGNYSLSSPLVVERIYKSYDNKLSKCVVKNLTFEVENGVVFGLLGPNGAGKSSLIAMLTGVYSPTAGTAKINDFDIVTNSEFAFRSIGVCPQFDILWGDLSIEEHLYFYARLKGVAIAFEDDAVAAALELVELSEFRKRTVNGLSGGEKRRVSIAISLVSNPKVVVLDEPTTGLDPEVRRTVWDTISRARGNRAILLTTHSMEESEVCCQKIGIMTKGNLRCIGSPSRLKDLYGCGYKLTITFEDPWMAENFVVQILPPGSLQLQVYSDRRVYSFLPDDEQLAFIFDMLVQNAAANSITSWGVNQTTLDEIFTNVVAEADAEAT